MASTGTDLLKARVRMKALAFAAGIFLRARVSAVAQQCLDSIPPAGRPTSASSPPPRLRTGKPSWT